MREHPELVYILQNKVEYGIVYFFNRLYSEPFSFNFVAPRYYLDFFDLPKFRISVFYIREHMELVYILKHRVEKIIVYFY